MSGVQTSNGKAFEYACLRAIYTYLQPSEQDIVIVDSPQFRTAKAHYEKADLPFQTDLMLAATAAVRVIVRLEPQLEYPNSNVPLYLSLQTDAQGIAGDVRDVLCIRRQNDWCIGLSCKHNHGAVKHSRLSDTIDFGKAWFSVPCSKQYFSDISPIFAELRTLRDSTRNEHPTLWSDIPDKAERYYVPILQAFLRELSRLSENNATIPANLIKYLIGRNDFYKVITDDSHRTTRVEALNLYGTLNRPSQRHRSIVDIAQLHLPSRFYHMGFVPGSTNTIEVVCDEGWAVSMRIHNASSRIEPSLKFDINLISLPHTIHAQVQPW